MKKNKHSHSEVGFILVISLGPEGVGSFADHKGVGGRRPPCGGGTSALAAHGAHQKPPPVLQTLSLGRLMKWNNYQNGQGDYLMGVSQGTVFGRVQYNPESGTQKYSKCQTPPHMKKTSCF